MSTRYVANREGLAALARDPQMGAAMMAVAKEAQAYAETIAPHGTSDVYSSRFATAPTMVTVAGQQRAGAIVINTAPYAHGVEWRNGQHVMARVAQMVDGRSRSVATTGGQWRRSEVGAKALRASRRRRARASQKEG